MPAHQEELASGVLAIGRRLCHRRVVCIRCADTAMRQIRWDVFCRIVDNFGDIGVTWRLARQLATEHGKSVRLWIDDMSTASKLILSLDPHASTQHVLNVDICPWAGADSAVPADVVIEAFACELPAIYLEKMAAIQPVWINLEYLSAEPWIEDFHAKPSRHAALPLTKYFFFPGFTQKTGGLLREHDVIARRDEFLGSAVTTAAFRENFSITDNDALKVSLFGYPHAPIPDLLQAFVESTQPILCLVPESSIWAAISDYFNQSLEHGALTKHGNLTLLPLPFLTQDEYDQLLWLCDINFVRGEDSWVRAIWAGKPFVWQPYRQQEGTHLEKLAAFLDLYGASSNLTASSAMRRIHENWSSDAFPATVWHEYLSHLPALEQHAAAFSIKLAAQSDLASKLVIFCGNA